MINNVDGKVQDMEIKGVSVVSLTLKQMLQTVKLQPTIYASQVLTLILYRLSYMSQNRSSPSLLTDVDQASLSTHLLFELLSSLPCLAIDRSCISSVLQVIQSLGSKQKLVPLKLKLLFELWKVENRCYPYLQRALETNYTNEYSSVTSREIALAKAKVIKEICQIQPHRYGADLLKLLSDLLNLVCSEVEGDLHSDAYTISVTITNMALEGITTLCKEGVIDIATTVKVMGVYIKFKILVQKNFIIYQYILYLPSS